jgi:hypothetical protein
MEYRSIADIYESNDKIQVKFRAALAELTDEQVAALPDGEKWSVAQIVEHVSLVENGICRICARLLSKAEAGGQMNNGTLDLSEFMQKADGITDVKLEAPEIVHPVNGRSIAESMIVMEENARSLGELRGQFEKFDGGAYSFPHPYLGELSALEWLALAGGHKIRHLKQIERVIEKAGNII